MDLRSLQRLQESLPCQTQLGRSPAYVACLVRETLMLNLTSCLVLQLKRQLPASTSQNALGGYREAAAEREPRTIVR